MYGALVRLVEHDHSDVGQQRRDGDFPQQHAVGHEDDARRLRKALVESHTVADQAAKIASHLLRDARRQTDGRHSARLRNDQFERLLRSEKTLQAKLVEVLHDLRALARSGLANDNGGRRATQFTREIIAIEIDWQAATLQFQFVELLFDRLRLLDRAVGLKACEWCTRLLNFAFDPFLNTAAIG